MAFKIGQKKFVNSCGSSGEHQQSPAGRAFDAILDVVLKAVSKGDSVTLVGFGTFKSAKRAASTGRNSQTSAEIKIATSTVPRFTAGAGFKTAVAGKNVAKK